MERKYKHTNIVIAQGVSVHTVKKNEQVGMCSKVSFNGSQNRNETFLNF